MKTIKLLSIFALFFAAFNLTSCATEDEPVDPAVLAGPAPATLTAQFDGTTFNSSSVQAILNDDYLSITGTKSTGEFFQITIPEAELGTYRWANFGPSELGFALAYSAGSGSVPYLGARDDSGTFASFTNYTDTAEITVTSVDVVNKKISGTFHFTGVQFAPGSSTTVVTKEFTNGTFTNVVYGVPDVPATGLPTLTTSSISGVLNTLATSGGTISSQGGAPITARGVVWSSSQNPTIANSKTVDGSGVGTFTSTITGLTLGRVYYVKAYATNSFGTAYGNQKTFTAGTSTVSPSSLMSANVYGIDRPRLTPFGHPFGGDISVQHYDNSTTGVNYILLQGGNGSTSSPGANGTFEINIRIPQSKWAVGTYNMIDQNDLNHDDPKLNVDFIQFSDTVDGDRISSGTVTITEFNLTTRKIKGTFSFVYYNYLTSGGPEEGPFNVSNGTFDYNLDDAFFD